MTEPQAPTHALDDWLDRWSSLLDRLLAAGVANLAETTRRDLAAFRLDAEDLGWTGAAAKAERLLDQNAPLDSKAQALLDLLSLHACAQRLHLADALDD